MCRNDASIHCLASNAVVLEGSRRDSTFQTRHTPMRLGGGVFWLLVGYGWWIQCGCDEVSGFIGGSLGIGGFVGSVGFGSAVAAYLDG